MIIIVVLYRVDSPSNLTLLSANSYNWKEDLASREVCYCNSYNCPGYIRREAREDISEDDSGPDGGEMQNDDSPYNSEDE